VYPQDCLPAAQVGRDTFEFPTKGDAELRMQTGPGSMHLPASGKDICTTPAEVSEVMATRVRNVWGKVEMRSGTRETKARRTSRRRVAFKLAHASPHTLSAAESCFCRYLHPPLAFAPLPRPTGHRANFRERKIREKKRTHRPGTPRLRR
jgi:hypothetical protein